MLDGEFKVKFLSFVLMENVKEVLKEVIVVVVEFCNWIGVGYSVFLIDVI